MEITVIQNGKINKLDADGEQSLLSLLAGAGYFIDAPCSASGKCGKCKVIAKGALSPITSQEEKLLKPQEIENSVRLACITYPTGSATVELIQDNNVKGKDATQDRTYPLAPRVAPSVAGNSYGLAVDIGTTTVAGFFYDLKTGQRLYTASGLNTQRTFGADVISRISYCGDDTKLQTLTDTIVNQINGCITQFCEKFGASHDDIVDISICGNTTMLHLLAKLDPTPIGKAPFTPRSLFGNETYAKSHGISANPDAKVYLSRCISGYVGGDVTVGVLSCGLHESDKKSLLIDIGTNGEMMLGSKDGFICCATAAGPAFEGAHIKHGTGSIDGAINKVWVDDSGDLAFSTINDAKPVGICGSGLIDLIAVLIKLGVIDETGLLWEDGIDEKLAHRYCEDDDGNLQVLLDAESSIVLTEQDVREIQLAKSAIYSGILTLLHTAKLSFDDLDKLYLAGGFGSFIDPKSACEIGLLPSELLDKIEAVGNAAGAGAIQTLLDANSRVAVDHIAEQTEYIELSGNSFFSEQYIENMCF